MAITFTGCTKLTANGSFTVTNNGALIVVGIEGWNNGTIDVSSATLDGGASGLDLHASDPSGWSGCLGFASFANVSSGSHTLAVTFSVASLVTRYFVMEFAGGATSSQVDGAGATATGVNTQPDSGSYTAGAATDVWVSIFADDDGQLTSPMAAGTNVAWTIPTNGSEVNANSFRATAVEYFIATASTGVQGQFTSIPASKHWQCIALAYKAAAGGATRGLFQPTPLTGVGIGGSFFANPLQQRAA